MASAAISYQTYSSNILCENSTLKIVLPWEDTEIVIPLNFTDANQAIIYKVIREMKKEIGELKNKLQCLEAGQEAHIIYQFRKIDDDKAKDVIVSYLKGIKQDTAQITTFEISQKLKLPADQVERIIDILIKEDKVSLL